jgi:hypothetical protein
MFFNSFNFKFLKERLPKMSPELSIENMKKLFTAELDKLCPPKPAAALASPKITTQPLPDKKHFNWKNIGIGVSVALALFAVSALITAIATIWFSLLLMGTAGTLFFFSYHEDLLAKSKNNPGQNTSNTLIGKFGSYLKPKGNEQENQPENTQNNIVDFERKRTSNLEKVRSVKEQAPVSRGRFLRSL